MKEVKQLGDSSGSRIKKSVLKKNMIGAIVTVPFPWLYTSIVLFLTIPLFIFFLGYLRLTVGIPLTLIFAGIVFYCVSDCLNDPDGVKLAKADNDLKIPVSYLTGFAITSIAISFVSGVGEYIYTLQDHEYRVAILRDLIDYNWPVIYDNSTQTDPSVRELMSMVSDKWALSYYFMYWMPSALAGKMFGFGFGNFVLLLWNSLGIFLTLLAISSVTKKISAWIPFFYVFFSGLDIIPNFIYLFTQYDSWRWIEGWVPVMSYVSNFRELASVYNQVVPSFLVVALLLMVNNTRSIGLTSGVLFCYSPWAVLGIIPMIITALFEKKLRATRISKTITNVFSPVNITSAVLFLIVFGSFYMTNSSAVDSKGFAWVFFEHPIMFIPAYLFFISVEIIPFAIILHRNGRKKPTYWAALITLLILPFYQISEVNDLSMRGSMPALFFICIGLCEAVSTIMNKNNTPKSKKGWIKSAAVMVTVILMMFPALFNLFVIFGSVIKGVPDDKDSVGSFGNIKDESRLWYCMHNYMCEDYEDSFFFKYLAK